MSTLRILPLSSRRTIEGVKALSEGPIIACDFYIEDIERNGRPIVGGYQEGNVISVDHHAPVLRMQRHVSSTNLAMKFVAEKGTADEGTTVVINHTDCDSVLSSAIVMGVLEPLPVLGEAAIAADHTGVANDIADMLQGIDPGMTAGQSREELRRTHFEASIRNVKLFLAGEPLEEIARAALEKQRGRRTLAEDLVKSGAFQIEDGLAFAVSDGKTDGAFFPALLPEAAVILIATPADGNAGNWRMKVRLGTAAPAGFSLFDLNLREYDPGWGGRWNAGSNSRGSGGNTDPQLYADEVRRRLVKALRARGRGDHHTYIKMNGP